MSVEELIERKVCPRCGEGFNYLERRVDRERPRVVYAVHRAKGGVKKRYLGAELCS